MADCVGEPTTEWTAVLCAPDGTWRPVGTVGDRTHALAEALDWCREGIRPGESIGVAQREVSAWTVDYVHHHEEQPAVVASRRSRYRLAGTVYEHDGKHQ